MVEGSAAGNQDPTGLGDRRERRRRLPGSGRGSPHRAAESRGDRPSRGRRRRAGIGMTAMSADRNDGRDTPDDLSSVFGAAAASSLRTVARHPERVESETTPIDAPVAETSESVDEERQDEQTLDPQESGATTRQVATTASSTSTDARDRARRRRLRPLQVHDRRLIHALLLTAVKGCPEGQNLIDRIRETSDGEILLP